MGIMSSGDKTGATAECTAAEGPAWKAAREYGCDMSIIADNLRKTPAERIRSHSAALNTLLMLKDSLQSAGNNGTGKTYG